MFTVEYSGLVARPGNPSRQIMTDIEKLITLRENLVARRRSFVASPQKAALEQLTGDSIARIQTLIDAVNRAIEEEMHSRHGTWRRAAPLS
jgi:hypothetical protein